jgi:crotonobetainyl-CoA:carnitine CoA-transferase CaiB-like acyl-CoA transferase
MLLESDTGRGVMKGVSSIAFACDSLPTRSELSPPPHYGEHSRAILKNILGYTTDQINRLIETQSVYARNETPE